MRNILLGLVLMASSGAALAQTPVPPPAISLPDLSVATKDLGDERKYVVFHKPGITTEQAEADLGFCWRFVPHGVQRTTPGFIPWQKGEATRKVSYDGGQFGLVGAAIGAIIAGPLERSVRQSRMFRCMVPRGYARYRTSEAVWKDINLGDAARAIHTQALIAAGPVPPTPRVLP